jgi:hypothetical protein
MLHFHHYSSLSEYTPLMCGAFWLLINIRKYTPEETFGTIKNWLAKGSGLRRVDFNSNYLIKYNITSAKRDVYLPISLEKLY